MFCWKYRSSFDVRFVEFSLRAKIDTISSLHRILSFMLLCISWTMSIYKLNTMCSDGEKIFRVVNIRNDLINERKFIEFLHSLNILINVLPLFTFRNMMEKFMNRNIKHTSSVMINNKLFQFIFIFCHFLWCCWGTSLELIKKRVSKVTFNIG